MIARARPRLWLLPLCLALMLFGCGAPAPTPEASPSPAAETPAPTPAPAAYYELMGREYPADAKTVELTGLTDETAPETAEKLAAMPALESILLGDQVSSPLSWDSISLLHKAAPNAVIDYAFTLYDKSFNLSDESMDLKYVQMDDEGALVKQVTACMARLKYLDMDSCGVSNESMAEIRDSLPGAQVVWRIWFGDWYTARTDAEKILASMPGKAGELIHDNVMDLQYCTRVKYLDLGHNNYLDTIEFCRYMPELEVLIVGMTFVEDFSPLENCEKLEYLEAMTSRLHDLSPLSGLKNLRHLNICYNFAVNDISPLYSLTDLERLWIGWHCPVDPRQVAQMQKAAPNCLINTSAKDPTEEGWRYVDGVIHPRYELLREQFGYHEWDFNYIWNDPLYYYG